MAFATESKIAASFLIVLVAIKRQKPKTKENKESQQWPVCERVARVHVWGKFGSKPQKYLF